MKTHKVIDLTYHEDEGNEVYAGTNEECSDFISSQSEIGYTIVPMTKDEINAYRIAENSTYGAMGL